MKYYWPCLNSPQFFGTSAADVSDVQFFPFGLAPVIGCFVPTFLFFSIIFYQGAAMWKGGWRSFSEIEISPQHKVKCVNSGDICVHGLPGGALNASWMRSSKNSVSVMENSVLERAPIFFLFGFCLPLQNFINLILAWYRKVLRPAKTFLWNLSFLLWKRWMQLALHKASCILFLIGNSH